MTIYRTGTYRVGHHHTGRTIIRVGHGTPDPDGRRPDDQLIAHVDSAAPTGWAARVCALLNGDGCTRVGMHNCAGTWSDHDHPDGRPGPPILRAEPRCICNDPPPTVDKPKNGTASRPPGWACPRHGAVI